MTSLWQEDQLDLSLTLTLTLTMSLTLTLTWQEDQLDDALMALVGEIGMSNDLDALSTSLFNGQLPHMPEHPWRKLTKKLNELVRGCGCGRVRGCGCRRASAWVWV